MKDARLKELQRKEALCSTDPYSLLFARNYWDKGRTLKAIRVEIVRLKKQRQALKKVFKEMDKLGLFRNA
jgi:DNA polymerase sigma